MTEEEKKEFEEFLQWKAERENQNKGNKEEVEKENTVIINKEPHKEEKVEDPESKEHNTGFIVLAVLFAIFVLFCVVLGISKKEHVQTPTETTKSTVVPRFEVTNTYDAKQDSIDKAKRIEDIKKTIKIKSAYLGRPNSASGVDAYFYYKNVSDKTIKYLVWTGYPMNAVGDRVSCEIRDYADYRGKDTGPIKPGKSSGGVWSCAWYNSTAKKLILTKIDIEYMDGSTFSINESEIQYIR